MRPAVVRGPHFPHAHATAERTLVVNSAWYWLTATTLILNGLRTSNLQLLQVTNESSIYYVNNSWTILDSPLVTTHQTSPSLGCPRSGDVTRPRTPRHPVTKNQTMQQNYWNFATSSSTHAYIFFKNTTRMFCGKMWTPQKLRVSPVKAVVTTNLQIRLQKRQN